MLFRSRRMDRPALLPWECIESNASIAIRIAAATAQDIVERRRREGDLLTEVALAAELGASRTPAREAMLQLERWGLVRLVPKKGAIVTPVVLEERRDLLAARAMLEAEAVREVVSRELPVGLQDLLQAEVLSQRASLESGDRLAFATSDFAFHAAVIVAAGNPVFVELLGVLGPRMARLTHLAIVESPGRLCALTNEHEQLGDMIAGGDAEGLVQLLRRHLAHGHGCAEPVD